MSPLGDDPLRATRWEIVGAWLHVWTPPRGVRIPPVPWRALGIGVAGLVVVGVVLALTVAPAIQDGKREGEAAESELRAKNLRIEVARLRRDQRPTLVRLRPGPVPAQVRAAIGAGARSRARSGELEARAIGETRCAAGRPVSRGRLAFDCLAVTRADRAIGASSGFPFIAIVGRDRRSFHWCKLNPAGGEGGSPAQMIARVPAVCRDR